MKIFKHLIRHHWIKVDIRASEYCVWIKWVPPSTFDVPDHPWKILKSGFESADDARKFLLQYVEHFNSADDYLINDGKSALKRQNEAFALRTARIKK